MLRGPWFLGRFGVPRLAGLPGPAVLLLLLGSLTNATPAVAGAGDVVMYASDVSTVRGNWTRQSSTTGAGGQKMVSADWGWSTTNAPSASPSHYFDVPFSANANTAYRVWVRLRADDNVQQNDSIWIQFSDAVNSSGGALWRIGSTSGMLAALETCKGCGVYEWGWRGGSWWTTETSIVRFPTTGTHTLRVQTREDGVHVDQIILSPVTYYSTCPGRTKNDSTIVAKTTSTSTSLTSSSTTTTVRAIPGTIQAEDFDNGGQGGTYWDASAGNNGGAYRATDVDIERSSEGGYNVGWTGAGEWMKYTVNVASAGTYTLQARVASQGNGGSFHVEFGGSDKTGPVWVPNTGGWQAWQTVSKTVTLSAGQQEMRIKFDSVGSTGAVGNLGHVSLVQGSTSSPTTSTTATPLGGRAWAVPGTVQVEDFDNGGLGVAYGDTTSGNSGGAYRSTDVDIERASEGNYDIGWVAPGEWLNYTVNVASSGTYTVNVRVASSGGGGTFHVEFGGVNKTGSLSVPNTGGWQAWRTVSKTVTLSAGVQSMRLVFNSTGTSGAVGNFNYVGVASGSTSTTSPTTSTTTSSIRIMTWNIKQGRTKSGVYNPTAQAQFMANQRPHVVMLQEVQTWDEYQPEKYRSLLQSYTGQTWYSLWIPGTGCSTGGGCMGQQILSRFPIAASTKTFLASSGAGRVLIYVNGVGINLFTAHLDYYSTSTRTSQLSQLMTWARSFGSPRIVGGDFNSWWGEYWIKEMEKEYTDTWQDYTGSDENGYTTGNVRFDYLFRSRDNAWRMTPTNCYVPWTDLSDHRPVVADFKVQ